MMKATQRRRTSPHDRHLPGATRLSHWLRRLWPLYCFLAALVTFGHAHYDSYQTDGDAVGYMDIADLIRAHNWHGIIDGYWNPLYPAFLALGQTIFHPTRYTELHAYYLVNFGIFLLEMLAVVAFTDALVEIRDAGTAAHGGSTFFMAARLGQVGTMNTVFTQGRS
jgi:hypothetical protein